MKNIKKLLLALLLFPSLAFATASECFLIRSGTFTVTGNGNYVAIPRSARRLILVSDVSAISGTSPSFTATFQHSWDSASPSTSSITMQALSAQTATGTVQSAWLTTGTSQTPLGYVRANVTISGTTPSITASMYLCYDEKY